MSLKTIIVYACFFAMVIFNSVNFSQAEEPVMVNRDIKEIDLNLKENEAAFSFLELASGESTLIQSEGKTVLINTGAEEARNELKMHMDIFQINVIDYLFITNFSDFHTGNVQWLVENIGVKNIVVAAGIEQQIKELLRGNDVNILSAKEGSNFVPTTNLKCKILFSENNEGRLALSISYGKINMLYMGISDEEVEKTLTEKYDLKAQILKVGYFGSSKGTSQSFLESVDPQIAVVFDKREKQPSADVMERLQAGWVDIFQPNKQGIVLIKCTKDNYDVTIIPTREEENL